MDRPSSAAEPEPLVHTESVDSVERGLRHLQRALGQGQLDAGSLRVVLPSGRSLALRGRLPGPDATLMVRDRRLFRRLLWGGDLGFAEAYVDGFWDSPDLPGLLQTLGANAFPTERLARPHPVARFAALAGHALRRNTRLGSRRNIQAHYDLGNEFYATWLDPSMTYSSALFPAGEADLAKAQTHKYRHLADITEIGPEHHVLELGCGWGGFAAFAAREIRCRVTALTISRRQFEFASRRIQGLGLSDRVTVKLCDYRDERGCYDRAVAIEMFEAVGEAYWPDFFRRLRARLADGGRAGLQVITLQEGRFEAYRRKVDFIQRYVFPGGMLPTRSVLRSRGETAGLSVAAEMCFGGDYARTISLWRDRFRIAWPALAGQGFDERFRRLWEYYFAYCEAGFRLGRIDVQQMVFAKG